jgi:hypothetical protein
MIFFKISTYHVQIYHAFVSVLFLVIKRGIQLPIAQKINPFGTVFIPQIYF